MGIDLTRIVEVYAPTSERVGSGYLIAQGLVLTAGHVVSREIGAPVEVRSLGISRWFPASIVWYGEDSDAALVRIPRGGPATSPEVTPVRWGEIRGGEPVACAAVGFPWAQVRPDNVRDTEYAFGHIAPASMQKEPRRYAMSVITSPPAARPAGGSPWAGMSGAALFSPLGVLLGVVVTDPARFEHRLVATRAAALLDDEEFLREACGGARPPLVPIGTQFRLEVAPGLAYALQPPYKAIPPGIQISALRETPSSLLPPEYGIVPFLGQKPHLEEMEKWCAEEQPFALRVLTGPGGSGKTRLAAEACVQMTAKGWDAGFGQAVSAGDEVAGASTFLVLDDAELHVDEVTRFIAKSLSFGMKLRLLLLSRRLGAWWQHLERDVPNLAWFQAPELALSTEGLDTEWREIHFRTAATAFAAQLEIDEPDGPKGDVAMLAFDVPLLVHAAALLDVVTVLTDSAPSAGAREGVLDALLNTERQRWDPVRTGLLDVDSVTTERAVALLTLVGAPDEEHAVSLLGGLTDIPSHRLGSVARWVHEVYPGDSSTPDAPDGGSSLAYTVGLRPDLLAARLLARVLPDFPRLVADTFLRVEDPAVHTRLLATLCAGASDESDLLPVLHGFLAERLEDVVHEASTERDAALAAALITSVKLTPDGGLASRVVEQLPEHSTVLVAVSALLQRQAVEHYRSLAVANPDVFLPDLKASLNNLSIRLSDLGRREEALGPIQEAVEIGRNLAEANPDAFLPDLAMSLNNLSNALIYLGRREQALVPIEEAVAIRRHLAEASPETFLPDLAGSLGTLSAALGDLGRREEALVPIEEAVAIQRNLAEANPDAFLPDLAMSLHNLSIHLGDLGRGEEALGPIQEAVAQWRNLAEANPDAFLPDLAQSLNNLSVRLGDLGRREEALVSIEEAVAIRRDLAEANPDALLPDLAESLNNLSIRLGDLGRREEALVPIEEAVAIRRDLAEANPDAFLPDLAMSLNNLSTALSDLGRREEALGFTEEAVAFCRSLAEANPDAFLPDLAMSLNNLSIRLGDLGRREEALVPIEEAVAHYRNLAAADPGAFSAYLAGSLNTLSIRLGDLGRREEAGAAKREAAKISGDHDESGST